MIVYAFDEQQGLKELKQTLTQILGSELQFRGFASASELLKIAEQERYDVVFADLEIQNRKGMYLLGEMCFNFPRTNYIGAAVNQTNEDALTLFKICAAGYIPKPYDKETLEYSLAHLRYPIDQALDKYK